jgi:hypothetical protein
MLGIIGPVQATPGCGLVFVPGWLPGVPEPKR